MIFAMNKYVFKPYTKFFIKLFEAEKKRLLAQADIPSLTIEHVGSTAVPGLGGKGIIDIAIITEKENFNSVSTQLQSLGYEFRPTFSTESRFYFIIYLPDLQEGMRRYHIHLIYPSSVEEEELLGFRDYLRVYKEEAKRYAAVKKQAALDANQEGEKYRQLKEHVFKKYQAIRKSAPKRIMILGFPGSGKSTFAVKLSKFFGRPLYHLDKYFFTHKWQERNYDEFMALQKHLVEQDSWIIEGNATRSFEMRFSRADLVLYFRFNRLLCLVRIFKRLLGKDPRISDRAEGCSEKVSLRLIRYLWSFPKRVREPLQELQRRYPHVRYKEVHSDHDLALLLKDYDHFI